MNRITTQEGGKTFVNSSQSVRDKAQAGIDKAIAAFKDKGGEIEVLESYQCTAGTVQMREHLG